MTAYFDQKSTELDATRTLDDDPESLTISEALERIEHEVKRYLGVHD